jgi:hypothetical protein
VAKFFDELLAITKDKKIIDKTKKIIGGVQGYLS